MLRGPPGSTRTAPLFPNTTLFGSAGVGTGVPGMQIDRRCGSGRQAVLNAAAQISVGAATLSVAGGAESMSQAEHYALGLRQGIKGDGVEMMSRLARGRITAGGKNHPVPGGMIETAENVRRQYDITREAQDELAFRSQQNWKRANEAGHFKDEIIPVTVPGKRGAPDTVVDVDEHARPDTTLEALAALRPLRGRSDEAATVTAGQIGRAH